MKDLVARRIAGALTRLLTALAPRRLRDWAEAVRAEALAVGDGHEALRFVVVNGAGLLVTFMGTRLRDRLSLVAHAASPRSAAVACAIAAVGLGAAYLWEAGAPSSMILMNLVALGLGLVAVAVRSPGVRLEGRGVTAAMLAGALVLLATSLFGRASHDIVRWVAIGSVAMQPSLILLPVLLVMFARDPKPLRTFAIALAALALALQPDRAMAFALVAGLAALQVSKRDRNVTLALVAGCLAFLVTLVRPDRLPAAPYTDGVLAASWQLHPLAGLAVLVGALLLPLPAVLSLRGNPGAGQVAALFGSIWLAIISAATIGDYPTPLVGYGASAIIGYLLSAGLLPGRVLNSRAAGPMKESRSQPHESLQFAQPSMATCA